MKDISVIVPYFNSSTYLHRCVESLCRQTISERLELVFVDDCSSDGSEDVIRETLFECAFDGNVVFVKHEINRGSAVARKTGVDNSSGKYIIFCDSDDWVELEMYERLLSKAEEENSDMVICDYKKVGKGGTTLVNNSFSSHFFVDLLKCTVSGSLCNKLILRSLFLLDGFIYPSLPFSEDYVLTIQASYHAKRISYVPEALYNYDYNPNSITQARDISKVICRLDQDYANFELVENFLKNEGVKESYRDEIIFHKLKMKNFIRQQFFLDKSFLRRWRKTFPELNYQILRCKYIGPRLILSYYLTLLGLWTKR